jgi:hypothetical protein
MSGADLNLSLQEISVDLERIFERVSFVQAGALFRELLREFLACMKKLSQLSDEQPINGSAIVAITRRLCELSREVIFSVDGDRLEPDLKSLVCRMYRYSLDQIAVLKHMNGDDAEVISKYSTNIRKRAYPSKNSNDPWESIEKACIN